MSRWIRGPLPRLGLRPGCSRWACWGWRSGSRSAGRCCWARWAGRCNARSTRRRCVPPTRSRC
ncbi:hypothetical protein V2I01_24985 [Micromonospora sp. BRA006-A]|nr:hypothetical protein [Micromonospora sp. BRA006-A]